MRGKKALAVIAGLTSVLVAAELGARIAKEVVPERSAWPTVETELKHQQLQTQEDYDVVFLGSSITEAAVDPAGLLPLRAYNAALPFSTPMSHEQWYRGEFRPRDGRIVVLGLLPVPYDERYLEDPLVEGIREAQTQETHVWVSSELLTLTGFLADWWELSARRSTIDSGLWTGSGHQTAYYDLPPDPDPRMPPFGDPSINANVELAIGRLAAHLDKNGERLVIMLEPGRARQDVDPRVFDRYVQAISNLASDLGVPFWNTLEVSWDESLFVDEFHFNEAGTRQFTKMVFTQLQDVGQLAADVDASALSVRK